VTISIMWFRRDLRLADNPALLAALDSADEVLPVFVDDPNLSGPSGLPRLAFLYSNLMSLNEALKGNLVVRKGQPASVISDLVGEVQATGVFCTEDFGPYGRERDEAVEASLAKQNVVLHRVDSPYAVEPGAIVKGDGSPFQVFTPFSRAWLAHGWGKSQRAPRSPKFVRVKSDGIPEVPEVGAELPPAGEAAAHKRLDGFLSEKVNDYKAHRDEPGAGATSRMSPYLKYGVIHPRQILERLGAGVGPATFRNELCWREFYADVLFHRPDSARSSYREEMKLMKVSSGKKYDEYYKAWTQGMTGYPIVDAGMRQLLGEAWIHNRVRMIVASFLIKDLHIDWHRGALHFMHHLVDGDIASNMHGWQWTAGTGTDAAPYFRIFNPVTQGKKFDTNGVYIKKWVPELAAMDPKFIHEPWKAAGGLPDGYPERIVDHDVERKEALARYADLRS
jgi:deoxyribodipyrimidine photo-lyase